MMLLALALVSLLKEQAAQPFPNGYRCAAGFHADGFEGGIWRDFATGRPDDFYIIQIKRRPNDRESGPLAIWSIDERPPAPPKRYGWQVGRRTATVFAGGPDGMSLSLPITDYGTGGIWLHWWSDGVYAGVQQAVPLGRHVPMLASITAPRALGWAIARS